MYFSTSRSRFFPLGLLLVFATNSASAKEIPDGPEEPSIEMVRPAATVTTQKPLPQKPFLSRSLLPKPVFKPQLAVKPMPKKTTLTILPKGPPPSIIVPPPPGTLAAVVRPPTLKLAPSAAEIENERKPENPPKPSSKPRDPRDNTPEQDVRWPTHVDYTRGPGSSLGPGTAGDRKGMMQEVSGPSQGVLRNRW